MTYNVMVDLGAHWVAIGIYAVATFVNAVGLIFGRPRWERVSYAIAWSGVAVHGAGLLYRWAGTGHGPYMVRYEVLSANAWVVMVTFLICAHFFESIRPASIIVFPAGFLMIGLGMFFSPEVRRLPPSLRSIWLTLHVTFYKISVATAIIALGLSILYLLKERVSAQWLDRMPSRETMDNLAYRFAGFSFTFWAIAMLAGSVWAYYSWGSFWNWDPIETWSLLTWVGLGIYLHLRRFFGWRGERAAYLYMVVFAMAMVTIFGVSLLETSLHRNYFT